jgi:hypothetical protein
MKTKSQPKIKFETIRYADLSTKYITRTDGELIGIKTAPGHIGSTDPREEDGESEGDFFAVQLDKECFQQQIQDMQAFGFSEHFIHIFKLLHQQRIQYVRIDANGGEVDGDLPIFDW